MEGQALNGSHLKYDVDYDLGNMVTLQNKEWGVTMDVRITQVKGIYGPGKIDVELIFGYDRPTLIDKIKKEVRKY